VVKITPSSQQIATNGTASINVDIDNAIILGGFDITLNFNPSILQIPSNGVQIQTQFLASTGRSVSVSTPQINNNSGLVTFGAYSNGSSDGPTGNGTLGTITFNAVGNGSTNINIQEASLIQTNQTGDLQPFTANHGSITVGSTNTASLTMYVKFEGINSIRSQNSLVGVRIVNSTNLQQVYNQTIQFANQYSSQIQNYVYTNVSSISNSDLTSGSYHIYVNGPRHLTRRYSTDIANGQNNLSLTSPSLLAGDVLDNDVVDTGDFNRMVQNFGCVKNVYSPPGKDCTVLDADIDLDDEVSVFDYGFLVGNYSVAGDQ